jgi:hypothetical protein
MTRCRPVSNPRPTTPRNKIANLNEEIAVLKSKIAYLAETGGQEFCENEFKAYHTLKILENNQNTTILDRAKAIASLFR